jgi:hypothetical protein
VSRRHPLAASAVGIALSVAVLVGACGGTGSPGASASASPSASPSGAAGPTPKPTAWPTTAIEAAIALGASDHEMQKAVADLSNAIATEDVQLMLGAADGLHQLLDGIKVNVPRLQAYPATAALGDQLGAAYVALDEAAVKIRDSIVAGDSAGVVEGFNKLAAGTDLYGAVRQGLADAATQAIFMKRTLLQ